MNTTAHDRKVMVMVNKSELFARLQRRLEKDGRVLCSCRAEEVAQIPADDVRDALDELIAAGESIVDQPRQPDPLSFTSAGFTPGRFGAAYGRVLHGWQRLRCRSERLESTNAE